MVHASSARSAVTTALPRFECDRSAFGDTRINAQLLHLGSRADRSRCAESSQELRFWRQIALGTTLALGESVLVRARRTQTKGSKMIDPKTINSKIDAAASTGKNLVSKATEKVSEAASKARDAALAAQGKVAKIAQESEHRLQEKVLKAGHAAQQIAAKVSHSAQETAQQVAHRATEVANAAEHRSQEVSGNKPAAQ